MKKLFLVKVFIFTLIALMIFLPSITYAESQQENYIKEELSNKNNLLFIFENLNKNMLENDNHLIQTIKAPILPNQKIIENAILPVETISVIDEVKSSTRMNTKKEEVKSREITVTATAYTAYCNGCSGITATGINLRKNPDMKVIAVDPKIIPLGSKVYVPGYGEAIAGDKGGAIKGNKIDVFINNKSSANKWGKQTLKITVYN